jgi:uncharacterized protein (TIGR02117 family)
VPEDQTANAVTTVYVVNLGWHTGVAIHSSDLSENLHQSLREPDRFEWIEVGWGDIDFYQAETYSYSIALRALFFSRGAVLHVAAFNESPRDFFKESRVFKTTISRHGLLALNNYIETTITRDSSGQVTRLGNSLYGSGGFYAAEGAFSVNRSCNSWTAELLNRVGCMVKPGLIRASSLERQLLAHPANE